MKIGNIVKEQQPEVHKKLESERVKKKEHLSFRDYENLMGHSSYRRGRGGLRQVRHD